MFGKTSSINLYTSLVLCASLLLSWAAPIQVQGGLVARQEIQPVVPGARVQPALVDLLDQVQNLQKQADEASGPLRSQIQQQLTQTKALLEQKMQGVYVLASAATFLPETTSTVAASSTDSTTPSTVTAPPSSTASASEPVVTVVTQEGSAIVVLASQGVTSTISLETRTAVPTASGTTSVPASSASATTSPASSTQTPTGSSTITTTADSALATAANSSSQEGASSNGAMQLGQSSLNLNMVFGVVVLGAWMVL